MSISSFLLPTALAGKVKQSVAAVCPSDCLSVCYHSIFWTDWPLNLNFCLCMGHDPSSPGIVSHRLRSKVSVKFPTPVTLSLWPRFSIEEFFQYCHNIRRDWSIPIDSLQRSWTPCGLATPCYESGLLFLTFFPYEN